MSRTAIILVGRSKTLKRALENIRQHIVPNLENYDFFLNIDSKDQKEDLNTIFSFFPTIRIKNLASPWFDLTEWNRRTGKKKKPKRRLYQIFVAYADMCRYESQVHREYTYVLSFNTDFELISDFILPYRKPDLSSLVDAMTKIVRSNIQQKTSFYDIDTVIKTIIKLYFPSFELANYHFSSSNINSRWWNGLYDIADHINRKDYFIHIDVCSFQFAKRDKFQYIAQLGLHNNYHLPDYYQIYAIYTSKEILDSSPFYLFHIEPVKNKIKKN